MKKKIIFQKRNFNYIYFLFNIIMTFINLLIEYKLYPQDETELDESEYKYYLPLQMINYLYTYNISDFLAVIPYLIRKRILKNKEVNIDKSKLIYISGEKSELKKKKKEIILHFILIGVFDFLQKFAYVLYNIIFPDKDFVINPFSCTTQLEIIFQFLCCYFILKIYFYKLQYLALFLNIGIFVIILIIDIVNIFKFNLIDGNIYYFFALSIIFYCNEYALVKKIFYMDIYLYISLC